MGVSTRPTGAYHLSAWRSPRPIAGPVGHRGVLRRLFRFLGIIWPVILSACVGCGLAVLLSLPIDWAHVLAPPAELGTPAPLSGVAAAGRPAIEAAEASNRAAVASLAKEFAESQAVGFPVLTVQRLDANGVWLTVHLTEGVGADAAEVLSRVLSNALAARLAKGTRLRVTCYGHNGELLAEQLRSGPEVGELELAARS